MTDRIDLDELSGTDEEETETGNRGDWLWREAGESDDAGGPTPGGAERTPGADGPTPEGSGPTPEAGPIADGEVEEKEDGDKNAATAGTAGRAVPHVPRSNRDRPAGVPESSGGSGAGSRSSGASTDAGGTADVEESPRETGEERAERDTLGETGPHGGGIDDMTLAFSYRAARRLADPGAAVADASSWADWIGVVGDVPAYAINRFQREHVVDVDFFNGSGTGPGERLAEIGPHSMFYAERMVLVGLPGEDEPVAERAGWEFVPLSEAAEGAGWELRDPEGAEAERERAEREKAEEG